MFHLIDPAKLSPEEHYEYEQLLRRVISITFPHTVSNLTRAVTLNVICIYGLAAMSNVVTRLCREMLHNRTHGEEIAEQCTVALRESHAELERTAARLAALQHLSEALRQARSLEATLRTAVEKMDRSGFRSVIGPLESFLREA